MREKLIELLESSLFPDYDFDELADHLIANDVVPVVRCKDCDNTCPGTIGLVCTMWGCRTPPDGFCFIGERKDNG